ncbi:MAG: HlyD family efflux transporter periplasmic adaptor subunit [Verrucomicrobiales bacterium]|nr:HlyD family efflux transporter periplasmic adaptor subunit [Verrucomicrobiales bacterium]
MEKLPPIPSPPGATFREFRITVLPVLMFLGVLGATLVTWRRYVGPSQLVGEVEAVYAVVSAPQAGLIRELRVDLLQRVSAGQTLAVLVPTDPRVLAARLDVSRARLELLRDNLDVKLRQENNQLSLLQLRLNWFSQRAELASLKARRSFYESELTRQSQLMAWLRERAALTESRLGAGTPPAAAESEPGGNPRSWVMEGAGLERVADYQIAKRDLESLDAEVAEKSRLVGEISAALDAFAAAESSSATEMPASLKEAVALEEAELRQLEEQVKPVALVASMDGVVSVVSRRAGENVVAGETILRLSAVQSDRVLAYLRQPLNLEVRTNMNMEVRSRSRHRESGIGRVLAVGSQIEPILPQLLPKNSATRDSEFGLPILVSLPPGLPVVGGEVVDLYPVAN